MAGNKISDFTEEEFTAFVSKIIAADLSLIHISEPTRP